MKAALFMAFYVCQTFRGISETALVTRWDRLLTMSIILRWISCYESDTSSLSCAFKAFEHFAIKTRLMKPVSGIVGMLFG